MQRQLQHMNESFGKQKNNAAGLPPGLPDEYTQGAAHTHWGEGIHLEAPSKTIYLQQPTNYAVRYKCVTHYEQLLLVRVRRALKLRLLAVRLLPCSTRVSVTENNNARNNPLPSYAA